MYNGLSEIIVEIESLDNFKKRLDGKWEGLDMGTQVGNTELIP